jgi:NADH dehydrogenase
LRFFLQKALPAPVQLPADPLFRRARRHSARRGRRTPVRRGGNDRNIPMIVKSKADTLVAVFGGSGFLGRHVVRALAKRQYRVRVAVRRPDLAGYLQPLGRVGQIHAVQANVRHRPSVVAAVRGCDVVINLVGILFESGRQRFDAVQSFGAEGVALAAAAHDARMVHVSAIGADDNSTAAYARAKWHGEQLVLAATPQATIFRPSILFGPNDDFFNRFAGIARLSLVLPLVGGGHTRFQPAFAGDVAEAIAKAVDGATRPGAVYELGGPEILTFKELMQFVLATIERRRLLVPLPFAVAKLPAAAFEFVSKLPLRFLAKPLLTRDQVELLRYDNVVSDAAHDDGRTLDGLGISPQSVAAIVPTYLWRFRKAGQFHGHVGLI